jgi:protein O-mannosyl-transferase
MKGLQKISQRTTLHMVQASSGSQPWRSATWLCLGMFAVILWLYSPALNGHFIFDDLALPFCKPIRHASLSTWISHSGVRPVLMISYWLNYQISGDRPFSYHFVNLVIHFANSAVTFLVLLQILQRAGWMGRKSQVASAIGALVFTIHPLQTESVSYVAGRSESLAALFLLLAYVVFLYRRKEAISWWEALLVLVLFGAAVKTKENAIALAPILILTDLFWPEAFSLRALCRNWRLYVLMIPGAGFAAVGIFRMLASAGTAGFSVATFKWYQYAFTEARAIFIYIRMAIWPSGLSLDHDFATSYTILEHGAICWMILLAALVAMSIILRRRYPLGCFGLLMFLIWLAPTSSVVPLDDSLVERRMYLPLIGLILIGCELGMRVKLPAAACVASLCIAGIILGALCYNRNRLWGGPEKLMEMAADNALYNPRPLLNFAEILIEKNECAATRPYLVRAESRLPNNYYVNVTWGRTLACLGYLDQAIKRFEVAAKLKPTSQVYQWLGLAYAEIGRPEAAVGALKIAIELDPQSAAAHGSLALWFEKNQDLTNAEKEYRTAASLDRDDSWARQGWMRTRQKRASPANF